MIILAKENVELQKVALTIWKNHKPLQPNTIKPIDADFALLI